MYANDLHLTDDPLVRRGKHREAYAERPCEGCGEPAWMLKKQRFCSSPCSWRAENNPRWTGDAATYNARHKRIGLIRGKAASCYNRELGLRACTSTKYEWSLLHGSDGLDPLDFVSLCVSCHNRYDHVGVPRPSVQGSKNGHVKLTEAIVLVARERNAAGESKASLAREYRVSRTTMRQAIAGVTWTGVIVT
jgi:hypothetical protein